jgi:serine/threonine-protein kinase RsbW
MTGSAIGSSLRRRWLRPLLRRSRQSDAGMWRKRTKVDGSRHEPALLPTEVELRFHPEPDYLAVPHVVAASIAFSEHFDIEATNEFRGAVETVCATLLDRAEQKAPLVCRYRVGKDGIRFGAFVPTRTAVAPDPRSPAWQVITAMVDIACCWLDPIDPGGGKHMLRIELYKRRRVVER